VLVGGQERERRERAEVVKGEAIAVALPQVVVV